MSIICEIQLILNQYLHQKKRVHKLYSILRERAFFEMAINEDQATNKHNLKDLRFEPILNVADDVQIAADIDATFSYKCAVDIECGLLSINASAEIRTSHSEYARYNGDKRFFCVDMETRNIMFEHEIKGFHSHHWITLNEQKYLSLQTAQNAIELFSVDAKHKTICQSEYTLVLEEEDVIDFYFFDRNCQNIFVLKNKSILEKRIVINNQSVAMINLEENIKPSVSKILNLSNDGSFCVVSTKCSYFYLIDIAKEQQFKLESNSLTRTYAPCFINGESVCVAVGGSIQEGVEIWDVKTKKPVRHIGIEGRFITSTFSTNNILAVGHGLKRGEMKHGALKLYDVTNWELFYSADFFMIPRSVHLTSDARYLTVGGCARVWSGSMVGKSEKCVVLEIQ